VNKVGFSVIYSPAKRDLPFYKRLLKDMLSAGCQAIELHTPTHALLDAELLRLVGQFPYRAIHTSDLIP